MNIDRAAIADALAPVAEVNGYPYRPKVPKLGDAWPLVESVDRLDGLMFQTTWKLVLWLGGDERLADEFLELVAVPIAASLSDADVLYVNQIVPVALPTQAGEAFGAEFTGVALTVDNS